jgi:aspartate racemase
LPQRGASRRVLRTEARRIQTIGLLGGMSWESTALYYRLINEAVRRRLGGLHSARIAMLSVDFQEIASLQAAGDWTGAGQCLADEARRIEAAGADFLLICTNTMHRVADVVAAAVDIPLLHLADATAVRVRAEGVTRVGLLGTRFTMEHEFYRARLAAHGLEVIVPPAADRDEVHRVIFEELCRGVVREQSRSAYLRIIGALQEAGAAGVIAGCTEIGLLVTPAQVPLPFFDTTAIHAEAAAARALSALPG